jgi:hypothetical protein
MVKAYFGDERDYCLSCPLPPETCDSRTALCRYRENTSGKDRRLRSRGAMIKESCGVKEIPLFKLNGGMSEFCRDVAKYSEPGMRDFDWGT